MDQEILRRLQLTELEILKHVHSVCEQNNLTYYLVGGTLLGAVRHGGFIPWDDDLDIAMPRKDYNKFIRICQEGVMGEKYYLHHTATDSEYWLPFAKIKKNNTLFDEDNYKKLDCHKGIFIDVFPLDYCKKNSGFLYDMRAKVIKKLSYIIYIRKLPRASGNVFTAVIFALTKPLSIKRLSNIRDKLCVKYNEKVKAPFIINYGSNYKYRKQTMPREFYEPAVKINFEDGDFYAPNQYIKYLEHLFKNWKQLPSEEERRNHNPTTIIFDTTEKGN